MSLQKYLDRHAESLREDEAVRPSDMAHWVVIPVKAELELLPRTLASLEALPVPPAVVVVINGRDSDSPETHAENQAVLKELRTWAGALEMHVLDRASEGRRTLDGVGSARRLGMDYALRANPKSEWLLSLDADAPVAPTYLRQLEAVPKTSVGALFGYQHPMPVNPARRQSMQTYELWLRYREYGLKTAGSPYAFAALGSIIAVRPQAYAAVHGMSRRDAAEDFHFIHKLRKHGPLHRFELPTVFPSARFSDRVPFGTGRAVEEGCQPESKFTHVEPPRAFAELGVWVESLPNLYSEGSSFAWTGALGEFLEERSWGLMGEKLRRQSQGPEDFVKRTQTWFDATASIRFLNRQRDSEPTPILRASSELSDQQFEDVAEALDWFRDLNLDVSD